ncbi:MAG: hypothetical protein UX08_C0007G0097 [Candidatus Collierbacteria bacterium GW2011_GWB1_45_35]|uniref:Toxin-antitoxin system, toxin component, RelE family n=2 Tax=Candidatus Collieribacteriota TaxID=1752725 RepID=A0A0G1KQN0_9BACT|nr:MAG: hypothetical protein UW48_C0001G0012 [Microgenomates group bacterium GW2011_GWC1_44_23]KKT85873.1 MAG: hypothetical protein UW84_C0020G0009 [Candidatus Collierbacteria bacterium GW2011_GWA2_44_99]KKT96132.1 MAG: hypothetical protein UW96_C0001G0010 [Candidatus Collierbacteria bacterium GW2011_GWA1_45_15]KKU01172.1 MAG: hypothetical protein UX01_C0001G0016 [Candidatus Collierbacteria bacterium GW2011_GWB2_45_17]KKU05400.1 MAG: hypothetical protein UX08_C0007G0097 [Candidatus Collierbacte
MKLEIDKRVLNFLKKIPLKDSTKALSYIELFEKYQFNLDARYLKKVSGPVWELRPGRIRLYLLVKSPRQIVIYAIIKKSQKITKADLKTIQSRLSEYL